MGLSLKNKFVSEGTVVDKEEVRHKINNTKGLVFDSKLHRYTLNGIQLVSGTTVIKRYEKPFQRTYISRIVANQNRKKTKKYLTNEIDVRKYWSSNGERRAALGTSCHAFCEGYMLDPENTIPIHRIEENAVKLLKRIRKMYHVLNTEVNRGSAKYLIGYTMDLELEHKATGDLVLGDYKFTGEFTPEQYKEVKGRMPDYLLDPFRAMKLRSVAEHKGYIQLNLYAELFEQEHKNKVARSLLFHIDGTGKKDWYGDDGFKAYLVPEFRGVIKRILKPHVSTKMLIKNKL